MMKRTQLYLPDQLKRKLKRQARERKCSEAKLIREYLEKGMRDTNAGEGSEVLVKMAQEGRRLGKKRRKKLPTDLAENHDYYLYGEGRIE